MFAQNVIIIILRVRYAVVCKMNLTQFIEQNNIPLKREIEWEKSDIEKVKERLEQITYEVNEVPFLDMETETIKKVNHKWFVKLDFKRTKDKKTKTLFCIIREFEVDNEVFNDDVVCNTEKELLDTLLDEVNFDRFLKYNNLIFDGRYLMNFDFKRVIYENGKVKTI